MNPRTRAQFDRAEEAARVALGDRRDLVVLDVGCGRQSNLLVPGTRVLIGVDIDEEGLHQNRALDHAVLADIVSEDIPEHCLDAVVSSYAFEHVRQPDVVIGRLVRALRPGGVFVLAIPDVRSPKALITRWTPFGFHRFVYRRVLGRRGPGQGGPFPTVLDPMIAPDRLERLMAVLGMEQLHVSRFEDDKQRQIRGKLKVTGVAWSAFRAVWRAVWRVDPAETEYLVVFRRIDSAEPRGELGRLLASSPMPKLHTSGG
jgi:SAM-dependent methyltransferase